MSDVMVVVPTFLGGGAEHIARLIVHEAARRGYHCSVVGLYEPPPAATDHGEVEYVGLGASGFVQGLTRLIAHVRSTRPKAILSTLKNACFASEIARRLSAPRARHVIRVANSYKQELSGMSITRKVIWRGAISFMHRSASKTILVSSGLLEEIEALLPGIKAHSVVIHNPVETPLSSSPLEADLPGLPGSPRVLMVGRLVPQKDYSTALAAFARLNRAAELLIVGKGELRDDLAAQAVRLGIADRVHFLGWRNDVPAVMRRCDLLLMTSRFEGFPNVLVEAMLAGIPLVATNCPHGPGEIITEDRIGELVPVGDIDQIAGALRRRIGTPINDLDRDFRRATALRRYSLTEATTLYLEALCP